MSKIKTIKEVVKTIENGQMIGIGGNTLHRSPMSIIREIARQEKKSLKVVKTAGAHDVDLLARAKCLQSVDAGFISYETGFGLATYYRKAVENGEIKGNEHACYTVMSALNAAKINAPFMPVYGMQTSDLISKNNYFKKIKDPFSDQDITVVKALRPDVSIMHVTACDKEGNAIIEGPVFDDGLLARASERVIISTEKIVSTAQIQIKKDRVVIPGFLVESIVVVPKGAVPCSCPTMYDVEEKILHSFLKDESKSELDAYLKHYEKIDYSHEGRVMSW